MIEPKLTKTRVQISYTSTDKFSYSFDARGGKGSLTSRGVECDPAKAMLASFTELTRLLELFGMGDAARIKFEESTKAVKDWRALLSSKETTE